jgi:CheY-like chemotaxis protein
MKKTILVVDDDRDFLEELEETLRLSGYDIVAVNEALVAVETARVSKPLVVLLDLKMPGKSGFQIADEIKRLPGFQDVPIIAMTAYFKDGPNPLLDICGFDRYLEKPFYPLDVIACIENVLKEK